MKLQVCCEKCLFEKEKARAASIVDVDKRAEYLRKVEKIMRSKKYLSPPEYLDAFCKLFDGTYGTLPSYKELKIKYNQLMMKNEEQIACRIQYAKEPIKAAIQVAQAANYIDFIAMDGISEEILNDLLLNYERKKVDSEVYEKFLKDLKNAKKIVYITDNCGEIVADKLLIREIKKYVPHLDITILTRGIEVGNDAVIEDARQVGLDQEAHIMGNGTTVAGTCIHLVPEIVKQKLLNADIIISKGQGNFETLSGCGENIYYLFLCKCELFMKEFHAQYLDPIFCRELDVNNGRKEISRDED